MKDKRTFEEFLSDFEAEYLRLLLQCKSESEREKLMALVRVKIGEATISAIEYFEAKEKEEKS